MKIKDILIESKSLDEAPVGMLKRAGLGIASKLGSHGAGGKLDTANVANQLKKDFTRYVGTLWNRKPDAELLVQWLQSKGYPTDGVEKMLAPVAQTEPADETPPEQGGTDTPPEQGGTEPNYKELEKPAFQRQGKTIPGVNAPAPEAPPKTAAQVNAAKPKKSKKARDPRKAALLQNSMESINEAGATLSGSQIDKALIQAVSDAAAAGGGASSGATAAGGGGASGGGAVSKFFQGVKKGLTGQDSNSGADPDTAQSLQGNVNFNQLAQLLPGVDPKVMQMVIGRIKQGKEPSVQQMAQLGSAFVALLKADPQSKQAAINLLKKMQGA
jgi:hypothetical protein